MENIKPLIRIHGKSQSRTALGILNAYLKIHPDATLSELQQAFPKSLNTRSFGDHIVVPLKETKGHEKHYFEQEDEMIVLKNGQKLALVELWQKEDFEAICEHAKQYGIEVAEFEKTESFEKGSYRLEYLNNYVPPEEFAAPVKKKCKCKWWWWLLALLLLLLILLFCFKKCGWCGADKCAKPAAVENVTPKDTLNNSVNPVIENGDAISVKLPDGNELKIDKNSSEYKLFAFLNSNDAKVDSGENGWITMDKLRFETGKTNLTADSENQLNNIAAILKFFPNSKIKLGGYSDNTGSDAINMRVSTARAKVVADKLIVSGITADRVTYEGFGSKNPVCPANDTPDCKAQNRRVEVKVTQK